DRLEAQRHSPVHVSGQAYQLASCPYAWQAINAQTTSFTADSM
ncbi:hypothetical protein BVRB_037520, partial [Beta vulgaris subsp. vulgaris]